MVETSVHWIVVVVVLLLFPVQIIHSRGTHNLPNGLNRDLRLNTTSGWFQGELVTVRHVSVGQFLGIPYGEKPVRFQPSVLRKSHNQTIRSARQRTPACPQASGALSSPGPFPQSATFDEDCLAANVFLPNIASPGPKAIMVFSHVDSAARFDGSAIAAMGDVIVISIHHRLSVFGFLSSGDELLPGNYGLHDQLLALKWISINARAFRGDPQRITYVGQSTGAVNALLLAMSPRSEGLIARVIALSGSPLNVWAIDRQPSLRLNDVLERNSMKAKTTLLRSNLDRLTSIAPSALHYASRTGLDMLPTDPFPVIDNDLLTDNLLQSIRTGPLTRVDLLVGVTADESVAFARQHMREHYLPKRYRTNPSDSTTTSNLVDYEQWQGFAYFKKAAYIKNFLTTNFPDLLCFYDEIRARYTPNTDRKRNASEIARLYIDLVSDSMVYYDFVRFLHERLRSESSAATYVFYYTHPTRSPIDNLLSGTPFPSRTDSNATDDIELHTRLIRYWTNFVRTGNPNEPAGVSVPWPRYEEHQKAYINLHGSRTRVEENFLHERFQFWDMVLHRPACTPFYWYQTCLLVGILMLVLFLLSTYIFYTTKRSRRNIKPTELITCEMLTHYQFLPSVVS